MPYITASIIIQLLRVVIPRFEELHKEGQAGTAKLTEYTRYLTIGLGVLQSATMGKYKLQDSLNWLKIIHLLALFKVVK
ncbi:hypothetical protein [Veillonella sp.]|uniref:hypothetical protein n=1 Tax=Veillonella sp. TaxID=1926307 RepID=UPI002580A5A0|nr:hypothetical protein [Veillonella sp.]